jgi:hypothetical protein
MDNLKKLQIDIQNQIAEERTAQINAIKETANEAEKDAGKKLKLFAEHFKGLGIDSKKYDAYNKELTALSKDDVKEIKLKFAADSADSSALLAEDSYANAVDASLANKDSQLIFPSFTRAFTTQEHTTEEISAMDVVPNGSTQKRFNWASGAGSGLFGTGAASNTQWVEFGFWFRPSVTKVYSIIPTNVFRGYYIVKADDAWYDSKEAKAHVNVWINVNQYNWKGWSTHNVMSVGSDNINVSNRLDTNRSNYHSALLAGGDWAFIRVVVEMSVYARGGGSYSELNFAAGTGNYLQCPYCIIS